ncbi:hypothetical protein SLA2020_234410 [Shorea laevis]
MGALESCITGKLDACPNLDDSVPFCGSSKAQRGKNATLNLSFESYAHWKRLPNNYPAEETMREISNRMEINYNSKPDSTCILNKLTMQRIIIASLLKYCASQAHN